MPVNKLMLVAFLMVLAGAVLPFLMIVGVLPSPLWLSFLTFALSVTGLFLGILSAAMIVAGRKRRDDLGG